MPPPSQAKTPYTPSQTTLPPYASSMHDTIISLTNDFFDKHHLRIIKHTLPLKLPPDSKDLEDVASKGKEMSPFTSVYRHMCNLKQRILHNWSYIETPSNLSTDVRNKDMPFNLRPLTKEINEQLDLLANDLNDPEFCGILLTLHSSKFKQVGFPEKRCLSKVIGGAVVEGLSSNDRCIKALWMHPELPASSTRLILQAFLPRLLIESFDLSVEADADAAPFKFVYAMHDDLDRWPRQAWLLMASSKKMGLIRHYEPPTSSSYQVDLDFHAHTDGGVNANSTECQCKIEKMKKSAEVQGWLERLIGCTEAYMYSLIPKAEERQEMGLPIRNGWIDMIPRDVHKDIIESICLLTNSGSTSTKSSQKRDSSSVQCNYSVEEWCNLDRNDLVDISSDSEVHFQKSGNVGRPPKNKKVKVERVLMTTLKAK